eukprot:scaffold67_cov192-Alexandrium_tamarense.AAC.4
MATTTVDERRLSYECNRWIERQQGIITYFLRLHGERIMLRHVCSSVVKLWAAALAVVVVV